MAESEITPTGIDKASALLLSLGVELSSKVLQFLNEGEIEQVLLALSRASTIPGDIRHSALREAFEI